MDNKICVYAIAKNESKNVDKWCDSVLDADHVVVLDTGSSDDTVEKLRKRGVYVEQKIIEPFRFDVARNESMKLVPEGYNILIRIDLDETFNKGWADELRKIRMPEDRKSVVRVGFYENDGYFNVKTVAHNRKVTEWKHAIHESFDTDEDREVIDMTGKITIFHHPDNGKDREMYHELIKVRGSEESDYESLLFCGWDKFCLLDYYGSIESMKKALSLKTMNTYYTLYAYNMIQDAYEKLGDDENCFMNCLCFYDIDKSYSRVNSKIGKILNRKGLFSTAILLLSACDNAKHEDAIEITNDYDLSDFYDTIAISYYYTGQYKKAYEFSYKAVKLNGDDERIRKNFEFCKKAYLK